MLFSPSQKPGSLEPWASLSLHHAPGAVMDSELQIAMSDCSSPDLLKPQAESSPIAFIWEHWRLCRVQRASGAFISLFPSPGKTGRTQSEEKLRGPLDDWSKCCSLVYCLREWVISLFHGNISCLSAIDCRNVINCTVFLPLIQPVSLIRYKT